MRFFWTRVLYLLAILFILGRIGNTLYGDQGFWTGIIKLYPPLSPELFGRDIESLGEDFIVFLAIRHTVLWIQERKGGDKATTL
jgi:hypothetical protein